MLRDRRGIHYKRISPWLMLKKSFCLDWARIFHDAGRTYSGFKASFFVVKDTLLGYSTPVCLCGTVTKLYPFPPQETNPRSHRRRRHRLGGCLPLTFQTVVANSAFAAAKSVEPSRRSRHSLGHLPLTWRRIILRLPQFCSGQNIA